MLAVQKWFSQWKAFSAGFASLQQVDSSSIVLFCCSIDDKCLSLNFLFSLLSDIAIPRKSIVSTHKDPKNSLLRVPLWSSSRFKVRDLPNNFADDCNCKINFQIRILILRISAIHIVEIAVKKIFFAPKPLVAIWTTVHCCEISRDCNRTFQSQSWVDAYLIVIVSPIVHFLLA